METLSLTKAIALYLAQHRHPTTKAHYTYMLGRLTTALGDRLLTTITKADLAQYLITLPPGSAHDMAKRMRAFFRWAADTGLLDNPPIIKTRYRPNGHTTWTPDDIATFRHHWEPGTTPRLVFETALSTGLRRSDLCRVIWAGAAPRGAGVATQKTGAMAYVDPGPALTAFRSPSQRPFTPHNLSIAFRRWCHAAGLHYRTLHGLRRTFLTRAAEAGCSAHEIAALSGHKTLAMVQHYCQQADRRRLAQSALAKLGSGEGGHH